MTAIIAWLVANWQTIALIVTGAVTFASIIVKLTPTQADDNILAKIIAILKIVGLNKED